MPTRWVHFRVDEQIYERIRTAATADRRSLSNWIAVACERNLDAEEVNHDRESAR
jgi:predicted HicB family RNase H-like nuclease